MGISPTEMMKDADMIIAWVEKNGETKLFDAFSTGGMGPHPPDKKLGETNDISTFAETELGEYTTIEFQRKLDAGDKFQINNETYWLDNVAKQMDTKAMIIKGRTMLPIRYLAEALGAKVGWNAGTQEVAIYLQFIEIKLQIGKANALINGKKVAIDATNDKAKPVIVPPERTLLPLRFVAESLQC